MGKCVDYTEIVGWDIGKKLCTIPSNSRVYVDKRIGRVWELYATDIDMIPRGLKGIDAVHLDPRKGPVFIAPDFTGQVIYFDKSLNLKRMAKEQIALAKLRYHKYQSFVEEPRYLRRKSDFGFEFSISERTLPNNMRFYGKGKKTYLDLTQTSIDRIPEIDGVDQVVLPADHTTKVDQNCKKMLDLYRANRQYE